jgi:hypothetical protein
MIMDMEPNNGGSVYDQRHRHPRHYHKYNNHNNQHHHNNQHCDKIPQNYEENNQQQPSELSALPVVLVNFNTTNTTAHLKSTCNI